MLNQQAFEAAHAEHWKTIEHILDVLESGKFWRKHTVNTENFPQLYATLCQHHAIATSRGYSHSLTNRLHSIIRRGHQQLYRYRGNWLQNTFTFIARGFPMAIRREWRLVSLAALLFFGPFFIMLIVCAYNPSITDLVLGSEQRQSMEAMYDPAERTFRPKGNEDSSSFYMFAFYIYNNVSIGFKMFAGGMLFGVGSALIAVFNGTVIGAVAGHLSGIGYGNTFWSFVPGHSAPELLGLVICGAAGLMLGRALISPGQRTRRLALLEEARSALPLVLGASCMIAFAAIIEAYWSPRDLALTIKISVGLMIWVLFLAYFIFAGRSSKGSAISNTQNRTHNHTLGHSQSRTQF